jgi:hypothetical protein
VFGEKKGGRDVGLEEGEEVPAGRAGGAIPPGEGTEVVGVSA